MGSDCVHVGFGLVKLRVKNMSTRHGDVVFLEDVLNESIEKTRKLSRKNGSNVGGYRGRVKENRYRAYLYTFLKIRVKRILYSVGILCLTLRVSLLRIVSTVMHEAEVF